jgi:hypothetical protein
VAWYGVSKGPIAVRGVSAPPDEDQRRMDSQQAQIQLLDQRVEMLEIKVRAMQELAGYQPIDDPRVLGGRNSRSGKSVNGPKP